MCFAHFIPLKHLRVDRRLGQLGRYPASIILVKYGFIFLLLSVLCFWYALTTLHWNLLILWPAINLLAISIAYFANLHSVFGKRLDGKLNPFHFAFFLPYHFLLFVSWHSIRLLQSERAFDAISDRIVIGRRLTNREFDASFDTVIDLTAEFFEPSGITKSANYISFPILDASSPSADKLKLLISDIEKRTGKIYIHCAQGHGRTGLVTAALLMSTNESMSPSEAISEIQRFRPALKCNANQISTLTRLAG